jgi:hypothetical protein
MRCPAAFAADSPDLRLELTSDDEPIAYWPVCWQQEFGDDLVDN